MVCKHICTQPHSVTKLSLDTRISTIIQESWKRHLPPEPSPLSATPVADLTSVGLVRVERQGRSLFYSVDLDTTEGLIDYLALDVGRARPDLLSTLTTSTKELSKMVIKNWSVLFICSGNSARSLFAEALLRDLGRDKFTAFSAGTRHGSSPNPFALEVLTRNGHDTSGLRSKGISEFQHPGAPVMDDRARLGGGFETYVDVRRATVRGSRLLDGV
ncbi:MAG: hypothetical protein EBT13_12075, partial [Rhodobacteraceae bacterium]|nr:hypothetical protein [Paracoccaceae bacterium]